MSDDIEKMLRAWRWEFAPIPVRELCERAADTIAELRKEVERLAREDEVHWKTRRTLLAQLAEANAALLRNGSRCELCGDPVPKGAAYCSECWLPP